MHSRQASKFALYRAQGINRGYSRGEGSAFVTGQIRDSDGRSLLIRRHCIGYVAFPTLYLTPYAYGVPYTLPCTLAYIGLQYPIPCALYPSLYPIPHALAYTLPCIGLQYPTLYPIPCTLYPLPDAPYTRSKPDTSDDASGSRYRTKKSPAGIESCRACSERRVVTYSKVGLDVSAPRMPAIVIVTSPINIEPND